MKPQELENKILELEKSKHICRWSGANKTKIKEWAIATSTDQPDSLEIKKIGGEPFFIFWKSYSQKKTKPNLGNVIECRSDETEGLTDVRCRDLYLCEPGAIAELIQDNEDLEQDDQIRVGNYVAHLNLNQVEALIRGESLDQKFGEVWGIQGGNATVRFMHQNGERNVAIAELEKVSRNLIPKASELWDKRFLTEKQMNDAIEEAIEESEEDEEEPEEKPTPELDKTNRPKPTAIAIKTEELKTNHRLQPREQLDPGHLAELQTIIKSGEEFLPPIEVYKVNGENYVINHHLYTAYSSLNYSEVWVEVVGEGDIYDAIYYAMGSNRPSKHFKLNEEAKRKAIAAEFDVLWHKYQTSGLESIKKISSNNRIATHIGQVSNMMVAEWREKFRQMALDFCKEIPTTGDKASFEQNLYADMIPVNGENATEFIKFLDDTKGGKRNAGRKKEEPKPAIAFVPDYLIPGMAIRLNGEKYHALNGHGDKLHDVIGLVISPVDRTNNFAILYPNGKTQRIPVDVAIAPLWSVGDIASILADPYKGETRTVTEVSPHFDVDSPERSWCEVILEEIAIGFNAIHDIVAPGLLEKGNQFMESRKESSSGGNRSSESSRPSTPPSQMQEHYSSLEPQNLDIAQDVDSEDYSGDEQRLREESQSLYNTLTEILEDPEYADGFREEIGADKIQSLAKGLLGLISPERRMEIMRELEQEDFFSHNFSDVA